MTRHNGHAADAGLHNGPQNTPRLRLKPKAPTTGHVDGAWWPHSDELPDELPDLLAVLSVRLGPIERVLYNLTQWATAPRRISVAGQTVRLDGYRLQPANTLQVKGVGGRMILLLVVPPDTPPEAAHDAMMTAATSDNVSTPAALLPSDSDVDGAGDEYHRSTFRRRVRGEQR